MAISSTERIRSRPHLVRFRELPRKRPLAQSQGMMTFTELASVPSDPRAPFTDRLRLAVAAYLTRFKDTSREHTESDLRCYLAWCAERGLDPLAAQRPHLELYIRWMQEIRRFKPSAVSRRLRVCGKGTKVVLVPLPPPVGRALDQATGSRTRGPVLLNRRGARMDRHAATSETSCVSRPQLRETPCIAEMSTWRVSLVGVLLSHDDIVEF
jgi:hypothetical protein